MYGFAGKGENSPFPCFLEMAVLTADAYYFTKRKQIKPGIDS
jgi:hypothetical protein